MDDENNGKPHLKWVIWGIPLFLETPTPKKLPIPHAWVLFFAAQEHKLASLQLAAISPLKIDPNAPKRKGSSSNPIHFRGTLAVSFREGNILNAPKIGNPWIGFFGWEKIKPYHPKWWCKMVLNPMVES